LAADALLPQAQLLHLHHRELVAEPLRTLERVYRYFELPLTAAARGRASSFVQRQPRAGYGIHEYDPAEFGLEPARIRQRFEPYLRAISELGSRMPLADQPGL
jgi:hypothetical protein